MKILNISGGATKISGLLAKAEFIINVVGYKPDIITGVSSGAILALPIALGKWVEIKETVFNLTLDKIFDNKPVKNNGKLSLNGVLRVILGKSSFGTQNNLYKLLINHVSEEEFNNWKLDKNKPNVYIGVTNYNNGIFEIINLKNVSYLKALDYIVASASIPLTVEGVEINGKFYYDGGIFHHSCAVPMMEQFTYSIKQSITIYSRPKEQDVYNYNFNMIDIAQVANRTQELMVHGISKKGEKYEILLAEKYGILYKQVFCPSVMKSLYDTDKSRIMELYRKSLNSERTLNYYGFMK